MISPHGFQMQEIIKILTMDPKNMIFFGFGFLNCLSCDDDFMLTRCRKHVPPPYLLWMIGNKMLMPPWYNPFHNC